MKKSSVLSALSFIVLLGVSTPSHAADFSGSSSTTSNGCTTTTTWSWWGLVSDTSTSCSGGPLGGFVSEHKF